MKRILLSLAMAIAFLGTSYGQTTTIDFETINDGYTASATEGSGDTDVFNIYDGSTHTGGAIGGNSTNVWAVEDLSLSNPSITLDQIDITGSSQFTFSIDLLAHHFEDWDSTDELLITYSIDGGISQNLMWIQHHTGSGDTFNGPAALDLAFDGDGDCGAGTTLPALTTGTQHGCTVSDSDFETFTTGAIALSSNSTLDITLQFNGLTSTDEGIYIDNIVITESSSGGTPTKLAVTTINDGSSPSTGTDFDVVVQLQDADDNAISATQDTSVTLSLATGNGALGGTLTGTISSGNNSVTFTGITYDTAESGVSITATNTGGSLTAGTSSTFEVLAAADQLVLVSVPDSVTTDVAFSSFTVEARRSGDSSVDLNYTKSVTVSIASGTGNIGGTTSQSAVDGVATFDDITIDAAGSFTIEATDGSLTSSASGTIVVSDPPETALLISGVFDGPLSGGTPKYVEFVAIEDIADLSDYGFGAASNGGGSQGEEYTFSAVSVSKGEFIHVASDSARFNEFFGFNATFVDGGSGALFINGDDAFELFLDGSVVDVYGDVDTDGSGESWDHLDGWGYRINGSGAATTFNSSDWKFSGINALDGETTNATASSPFPLGTYTDGTFAYIQGDAGWRLLSLPKTGGTIADISDDTPIQGVTGGSDASADANFIIYDNSATFEQPTNTSTAWGDGLGFGLYFFDNTTNGSEELPIVLDVSGSEPGSDVAVTLNPAASGYTLVGNPFQSNFNTNNLSASGAAIQNNIHFWSDSANTYKSVDRTTSKIVAPFQGFWVQLDATGGATTLTIPTAGKTTTETEDYYYGKTANNSGDISFSLKSETTNDAAIRIAFRGNATTGYDLDDAGKLTPLLPAYATMAFESNDVLKSVESLPYNLEEEITLPLELTTVGVDGEFTFAWNGLETIPGEWELILHDYEANASVNMRDVSEYVFTAGAQAKINPNPLSLLTGPAATAMKAKADGNRFGITLRPTSVSNELGETPLSFGLEQNYPNPFNPSTTISYTIENAGAVNISVYNLMGQKVATLVDESKAAGTYSVRWNASGAASGMYYYRLESAGLSITRKMTLIK